MRIQISDDSSAMWMKWDSITVNSEVQEIPNDCVLLLKQTSINSGTSFGQLSSSYSESEPTWC